MYRIFGDGRILVEEAYLGSACTRPGYVRLEVVLQHGSAAAGASMVTIGSEAKAQDSLLHLSVGPVLGEVTSTSARILVEVSSRQSEQILVALSTQLPY